MPKDIDKKEFELRNHYINLTAVQKRARVQKEKGWMEACEYKDKEIEKLRLTYIKSTSDKIKKIQELQEKLRCLTALKNQETEGHPLQSDPTTLH